MVITTPEICLFSLSSTSMLRAAVSHSPPNTQEVSKCHGAFMPATAGELAMGEVLSKVLPECAATVYSHFAAFYTHIIQKTKQNRRTYVP